MSVQGFLSGKKMLFLSTFFLLALFLSGFSVATNAAQMYSEDTVDIKASSQNVYATGQSVNSNETLQKDLVVAGGNINITGNVARSIIAAGNNLQISPEQVGAATRVAGSSVEISGNFQEEVIVAGNQVKIQNATIKGDLIVTANMLTIENSVIAGDAKVSYITLNGNLDEQVQGELSVQKGEKPDLTNLASGTAGFFKLGFWISSLIFLLAIGFLLYQKDSLHLRDVRFNLNFLYDFLIGLGLFIVPFFTLIISFFLQFYWLNFLLLALIFITGALADMLLPLYLASLIKNTAKLKIGSGFLIAIVFVVLAILDFIPFVNIVMWLPLAVFKLANFGFLWRKFVLTSYQALDYDKNNSQESQALENDEHQKM